MTNLFRYPDKLRFEPGESRIPLVNWMGLYTLYAKEVRRFFKVQLQAVWAPAFTSLLFLTIFDLALGRNKLVLGVPFLQFVAPGLIVMSMLQNSFANTSSSLLIGKIQGTIIESLMAPLSEGELLNSYILGAVTRAWLVGLVVWCAMQFWPGLDVTPHHVLPVLYFGMLGSVLLALLGVLTGIWAEKFEHGAAVTNFIVQPLSLLSGTFFTVNSFHYPWKDAVLWNPFYSVISGFRYGFLGVTDGNLTHAAFFLAALCIALYASCYVLLKTGWRLRN